MIYYEPLSPRGPRPLSVEIMGKNELQEEVPPQVEAAARGIRCHKGVKYVYRDGVYPRKGPATGISCKRKASRLHPERLVSHKVELCDGWVAFKAVGSGELDAIIEPLPSGESIGLPLPRIGKVTRTKKIDGTPLVFRVDEEELFHAPGNVMKAYLLQKLRMDDGKGFNEGHDEYRIAYYMIGHKGRSRNKWAFGQFAPIMTPDDLAAIIEHMRDRGWLPAELIGGP
jgi:hypothetical protein